MVKNALGRLEGRAEAQKIAQGLVNRVNRLPGLRSADLTVYVTQGLLEKLKPGRSKCPSMLTATGASGQSSLSRGWARWSEMTI